MAPDRGSASGLGAPALAGYLARAIALAGTLMAVFLANSGGSWDNAEKLGGGRPPRWGKGSDAHEATIIGDTVGDPFKDTAGPAINPLIKVMNLVAVLIAPAVVALSPLSPTPSPVRYLIALAAVAVIVVAVVISTKRQVGIADDSSSTGGSSTGTPSGDAITPGPDTHVVQEQSQVPTADPRA